MEEYKRSGSWKDFKKDKVRGKILVVGGSFLPYDFNTWQDCAKYLGDRSKNLKRSIHYVKRDNEHLVVQVPFGEFLTIVANSDDLEKIHQYLILQNLYYPIEHF